MLLMILAGSRRANTSLRYDVRPENADALAIVAKFDEILVREASRKPSIGFLASDAQEIAPQLVGSAAWDVVHQGHQQPFLAQVVEYALFLRLSAAPSEEIGDLIRRGFRDAKFTKNRALARFYCEQALHAAARQPPPPLDDVIRMLESLHAERKRLGPLNGPFWETTLQKLAQTHVVQLPIPAEHPQTVEELPIPSDGEAIALTNLPAPAQPETQIPRTRWWKWR